MTRPLRIALFMSNVSRYNVLHHFTEELSKGLQSNGHDCRILVLDKIHPKVFLKSLTDDPPDFSLTFNAIKPNEQNVFLSDILGIPHFSYLVDSPSNLFALIGGSLETLLNSRYSMMSFPDRDACEVLKEIGFPKVFFLPHGVKRDLKSDVASERSYDVLMLESFIDADKIYDGWKNGYSSKEAQFLIDCVEHSLENPEASYLRTYATEKCLVDKGGHLFPEIVRHYQVLNEIEFCVRGIDRLKLAESVKNAKLDIFGEEVEGRWKDRLNDRSNVQFHSPVDFDKAIEVMQKSKIVLNSCSWIRDGGHERLFTAMAAGALVISTRTAYLEEQFKDREEVIFYDFNHWDQINELIDYYLSHDRERREIAARGQKKVLEQHTWDRRAATLVEGISKFLS